MTADTFSSTLGVALMVTGNDNNTWGAIANTSVFQIFEDSIVNPLSEVVTGGTLDLSGSPPPAAASQVRYAIIVFTGVLGSNQIVKVPNLSKTWLIANGTTGAFTLKIQTPSGALSTAIPQNGNYQTVICNGQNTMIVSPYSFGGNTSYIQLGDGSVSSPGYSNINEPTSGWYRAGTQDWRLSINGIDAFQVTGAGASSPYAHNALGYGGFGPLMPPGAEMSYPGITAPTGWVFEFGQAVSRPIANGGSVDTYKGVWNAITTTVVGSTNSNTAITGLGTDMRFKGLGRAFVEGTGIQVGTTITFTGASTGTLSIAALSSTPGATLRIIPFGQGDGSTTFNIPNRCNLGLVGRGDMNGSSDRGLITVAGGNFDGTILGTNRNAGDIAGGGQNQTLGVTQIPGHTHSGTTGLENQTHTHNLNFPATNQPGNSLTGSAYASAGGTGTSLTTGTENQNHNHNFTTDAGTGGGLPHPNMPPSGVTNWIMKL